MRDPMGMMPFKTVAVFGCLERFYQFLLPPTESKLSRLTAPILALSIMIVSYSSFYSNSKMNTSSSQKIWKIPLTIKKTIEIVAVTGPKDKYCEQFCWVTFLPASLETYFTYEFSCRLYSLNITCERFPTSLNSMYPHNLMAAMALSNL